ncbi:hypothetical protein KI688_011102 [Linnemannia hyalina]|uniref:Uncharacterized protein n=1 Tax=Linnemannia hyalina TaxID=64524 RepID=A0A9P8BV58_9FUNG|nr:hypothetical protein KI688_011102 [Linnemannia hyalina]
MRSVESADTDGSDPDTVKKPAKKLAESSPMEQGLQVWRPDDADAAIARSEELENEEHEDEHETVAVAVNEVVDVDMEILIGNTREDDNDSVEIIT